MEKAERMRKMDRAVTLLCCIVWAAGFVGLLLALGFCAEVLPGLIRRVKRRITCRGSSSGARRCCRS